MVWIDTCLTVPSKYESETTESGSSHSRDRLDQLNHRWCYFRKLSALANRQTESFLVLLGRGEKNSFDRAPEQHL